MSRTWTAEQTKMQVVHNIDLVMLGTVRHPAIRRPMSHQHRNDDNPKAAGPTDSGQFVGGEDAAAALPQPTRIPWPPLLITGTVLGAIGLEMLVPLAWPGVNDTPARVVGLGFGVIGLFLIGWAALTLRRHRTTIMPHRGADRLVTDGPFAWRRNPIYLGDVFIFLCLAEVTKNVWFAILVPVFILAVTWLAILPEERHLMARFGDAYKAYKERTRRWL